MTNILRTYEDVLADVKENEKRNQFIRVMVVWKSPFGNLEHRDFYFTERGEARDMIDTLEKEYEKLGMPYHVYNDIVKF